MTIPALIAAVLVVLGLIGLGVNPWLAAVIGLLVFGLARFVLPVGIRLFLMRAWRGQ